MSSYHHRKIHMWQAEIQCSFHEPLWKRCYPHRLGIEYKCACPSELKSKLHAAPLFFYHWFELSEIILNPSILIWFSSVFEIETDGIIPDLHSHISRNSLTFCNIFECCIEITFHFTVFKHSAAWLPAVMTVGRKYLDICDRVISSYFIS